MAHWPVVGRTSQVVYRAPVEMLAEELQTGAVRTGAFTYLAASVESSLYRTGKVFMRRDSNDNDNDNDNDSPWEGAHLERRRMPVNDARDLAGP